MSSWNGAVATREETRATKRRVALRVAARIFNEKGYHATSLEEIAEAIGVTKTALYYYFSSKEDLLYACLRLSYDCARIAREEAEAMTGSGFERFCHLYRRFMELLMEERCAYTTSASIRALPQARQDEFMDERRRLDRLSRHLLSAAVAEGSIRPIDVRLTSNYAMGTVNWILRWYTEQEEHSPQEIAGIFIDLLTNGIAPRPEPA